MPSFSSSLINFYHLSKCCVSILVRLELETTPLSVVAQTPHNIGGLEGTTNTSNCELA